MEKRLAVMDMSATWIVVTWVYMYVKTYQTVHSKPVWFIICQLNLNKAVKHYDGLCFLDPQPWSFHLNYSPGSYTSGKFLINECLRVSASYSTLQVEKRSSSQSSILAAGSDISLEVLDLYSNHLPKQLQELLQNLGLRHSCSSRLTSSICTAVLSAHKEQCPSLQPGSDLQPCQQLRQLCAKFIQKHRHAHSHICPRERPSNSLPSRLPLGFVAITMLIYFFCSCIRPKAISGVCLGFFSNLQQISGWGFFPTCSRFQVGEGEIMKEKKKCWPSRKVTASLSQKGLQDDDLGQFTHFTGEEPRTQGLDGISLRSPSKLVTKMEYKSQIFQLSPQALAFMLQFEKETE